MERENAVCVCIVQCTQGRHYLSEVDITALYHARIGECKGGWVKEKGQSEGRGGLWGVDRLNRATSMYSKLRNRWPIFHYLEKLNFVFRRAPIYLCELFAMCKERGNDVARRMKTLVVKSFVLKNYYMKNCTDIRWFFSYPRVHLKLIWNIFSANIK